MINGFRFWCHKVLPLVYDDSLSYYELLCKVVKHMNEMGEEVNRIVEDLQQLKDYVDNYFDSADFEKIVEDKLNEMVDSGEFDTVFEKVDTVSNLQNIYVADYIIDSTYQPSSVVRFGANMLACIIPRTESYCKSNHTDNGIVKFINNGTNTFGGTVNDVELGHGNSACYDRNKNRFLIAPIATYVSGSRVSVQRLISYNAQFDDTSKAYITTPETPYGVSCDEKGDVYLLTYWNHIYKLNSDDTWTLAATISPSLNHNDGSQRYDFNQGFAVHDNTFYVSNARGVVAYGNLSTGKITGYRTVAPTDFSQTRRMGELEDFEFGTDGVLYAQRYYGITDRELDATIVEIPLKKVVYEPFNNMYVDTNNTFHITDATCSTPRNGNTELKHPSQINMFKKAISVDGITINTNTVFKKIVFNVPIMISVTKLICNQIVAQCGEVSINGQTGNEIQFNYDSSMPHPLQCEKTGCFNLCGLKLNITYDRNFVIGFATLKPINKLRFVPDVSDGTNSYGVYMEDTQAVNDDSLYFGTHEIFHYES